MEAQFKLPKEAHQQRRDLLQSIRFLTEMVKSREAELSTLYAQHSPQLELFPGLFL